MSSIRDRFKVDSLVKSLEHEVESRTEKITLLEQKDSVTGLLNRTSFLATVKSLQEAHLCEDPECRCAMIYIHLSKFQLLCSNYGHGYGDYVLNVIGKRLLNIDERYNTIASKWNGSGFILYFPHGNNVSIARFIENINHLLSREIQYLSLITTPSFHYGFYELGSEMTLSNAVNNAYLSMLEGKKKNIKIYSFDQGLKDKLQWQEELLAKMTTAINADDFYMVYQPIVDVTTDNVSGFEALIRWELDGKFVSPDDFIPIAEQHGLIFSIGKLVLRSSLQTLHEINQHLPHISMSINVSVIQFEDEHFLDHLRKLLSEFDVRVENIHLEVTETAMIRDLEKLSYVISEIKKMGVRISIDDFGTGFSSIAVLKSLNVDYIKIDKTYIDDICHDEKDRSIVSALTKMSHAIDVKVIAEGVEEESQKTLLSDYDVDFYQGYLFSKPMQKDDAFNLLGIKSDDASAVVNSGW
ncbi:bifunctional diguanylate cyclase/phosphodiesterase [Vibrio sp. CDRSL-10 TSBA]